MRKNFELGVLVLLALAACGLWAFVELLDEVLEGSTGWFDEAILLAMRAADDPSQPIGPPALQELMRDFTAMGGVGILTLLTLIVTGFLVFQRHNRTAVFLVASVGTGIVVSSLFKHFVSRPRPDLVPHGSIVSTSSFPSGHSLMSAVVYLTLAIVIARTQKSVTVKAYVLTVAAILAGLVGISRVYLGVHWPTDVMAGWALGGAWAVGFWALAEWLEGRKLIQPKE